MRFATLGVTASAVFVDTGPWVGLLNRKDSLHAAAVRQYDTLRSSGTRLVTSNYVVDEAATRLRYDMGLLAALAFRNRVTGAEGRRILRVAWVTPEVEREGWNILAQYADVRFSLTDAVTIALARRLRISSLFTFDQGFAAAGMVVVSQG